MAKDPSETYELFRLLERLPVGVLVTDVTFRIKYANTLFLRWIPFEDYTNASLFDFFPHLNEKKYRKRLELVASGGPSAIFSSQLHPHLFPSEYSDGKFRVQQTTITLEKSSSNEPFVLFSIQDVTETMQHLERIKLLRKQALEEINERKETQQKLQERETQFRLMVEGSEKVFFYYHNNLNIFEYISPSVQNVLGYDADVLLGTNFLESLVIPNSLDDATRYVEDVYKSGVRSEPYNLEVRHKNGSIVILEVIETPVKKDDVVLGIQGFARDVTHRIKSEEELRESRELLSSINRNISEGIYRSARNSELLYVNQAFVKLFGYDSAKELLGSSINKLFADQKRRNEIRNLIWQQKEFLNEEVEFVRKDGTRFWGLVSGNAIFSSDGNLEYFDGAVGDITNRKRDLEKLRESEEQYRNLFQNSMVGMYRCAIDTGFFQRVNTQVKKIFEIHENEDVTQKRLLPDQEDWERLNRILKSRRSVDNLEFQVTQADGKKLWINISALYFEEEGYFEGVVIDNTERKQAEILQNALYRIADLTASFPELDYYYRHIHSIVSELMPATNFYVAVYDRGSGKLSYPYYVDEQDVSTTESNQLEENGLTNYIIQTGTALLVNRSSIESMIEKGAISSVGSMCEVWLGVPLKSHDGIIGAIVTQSYHNPQLYNERHLDILTFVSQHVTTAIVKKKTEESIINAKEEAEAASKSKSIFLANVSHELRTPLNSIIGFTRRVLNKSDDLDKRNVTALSTVKRNAENLLTLINDILDLSKVEAGKISYRPQKVNVSEVTTNVVHELEPVATAKHIFIKLKKEPKILVSSDPVRLRQIMFNIIGNAVKFTDKGGIYIHCTSDPVENLAIVTIKDTGLGIPEDKLEAIFNIFEQANSDRDEARGGTGLGLSISKKLIEQMNGRISVRSQVGEGSEFVVTIPLLKEAY